MMEGFSSTCFLHHRSVTTSCTQFVIFTELQILKKNASVQEAIDSVLKSHTFSREISAMEDEDTSSSDLGSNQVANHAGY